MRSKAGWSLVWGVFIVAGLIAPTRKSAAANCALYARAETGVYLYGSAGGWWDEAAGRYQRGHVPEAGAILVFKRTRYMPSGHVAVVAKVVSPREILVDHANWYHGTVSRGMSVIDTSPDNDWSSVSVLDLASGRHGRDNPADGFVYPETGPRETVANETYVAYSQSPGDMRTPGSLVHFAVLTDDRYGKFRRRTAAHSSRHRGPASHRVVAAATAHERGHAPARHVEHAFAAHPSHTKGASTHAHITHAATTRTAEVKHHRA